MTPARPPFPDKIQLLLIEDDVDYADIIKMCLDEPDSMGLKFELERADRLEVGLKLLETARFDALLLDLSLPDSRGLDTIKRVFDRGFQIPILVMTNLGDEGMAFEAMRLGAQDYMVKATSDSRLIKRAIWYAIERQKLLNQTESIVRHSPDGMVIVDEQGIVQFVNPSAEKLLGRKAQELREQPLGFPLSAGMTRQHRLKGPAGETILEIRVGEVQWRGKPALLAVLRDITELQRVEQLRAEVKERRRLDQLKDELIGTVSHELRTPLTIIKGAVDNLREGILGSLAPRQGEVVELAHRNLIRLTKMINNLLDLSRLESGQARARRRKADPAVMIEEVVSDFEARPQARRVELRKELGQGLPPVFADPEMIAEVLVNLLDNALRFAKSRVVVSAAAQGGAGGPRSVVFSVADDGPGIPPDKVQDLFNKFVQINRAVGGSGYKGTGLGLAISKDIMDLHDSRITVDSVPGLGCRFSFALPEFAPAGVPAERRSS